EERLRLGDGESPPQRDEQSHEYGGKLELSPGQSGAWRENAGTHVQTPASVSRRTSGTSFGRGFGRTRAHYRHAGNDDRTAHRRNPGASLGQGQFDAGNSSRRGDLLPRTLWHAENASQSPGSSVAVNGCRGLTRTPLTLTEYISRSVGFLHARRNAARSEQSAQAATNFRV